MPRRAEQQKWIPSAASSSRSEVATETAERQCAQDGIRTCSSTPKRAGDVDKPRHDEQRRRRTVQAPSHSGAKKAYGCPHEEKGRDRSDAEKGHRQEAAQEPAGGILRLHTGSCGRQERGIDKTARQESQDEAQREEDAAAAG